MIIFINHLGFIFFISEGRFRIFDLKLEYEFFPCGYTSGYTSRGMVKEIVFYLYFSQLLISVNYSYCFYFLDL